MLRDWVTKVHAQVVSTVVQPGRLTTIQSGVTFHIRERRNNGQLFGVFLDDRRNPNERITIIAEVGELVESDNGTFLILQNGILQRQQPEERDPAMVAFDSYAFDLSQFASGPQAVNYSIRERYLWQLIFPDPNDRSYIEQPNRFRAELHDRLLGPLYPLAFVVIALTYLTAPRTTRQSRVLSIVYVIGWAALLRLVGVLSNILGVTTPWMLSLPYVAITIVFAFGLFVIHTGAVLETPAFLVTWFAAISQRNRGHVAAK